MTMKLKAKRFRLRRPEFPETPDSGDPAALFDAGSDDGFGAEPFATAGGPRPGAAAGRAEAADRDEPRGQTISREEALAHLAHVASADEVAAEGELDAIRREGLTGRQLRLARRIAQRHDLPATSDFDAVRLLRRKGIDPFQRGNVLDLVASGQGDTGDDAPAEPGRELTTTAEAPGPRLPQTIRRQERLPSADLRPDQRAETNHAADIIRMQQDIARRRRRRSALLSIRLFFFVILPSLICGWYFYMVATPLYATKSEFMIQQSQNPTTAAGGMGGLFQGSALATQQDSVAVQGYLQSREAMLRLDSDLLFRAHFADPALDPIIRLPPDATAEAAYRAYQRYVRISYDPTDGRIRMEVSATDPEVSAAFSRALIGYAEAQVDHLTQRMREDQMKGARDAYLDSEQKLVAAQRRLVEVQEQLKVLSSDVEVQLITTQISGLETMLTQDRLSLQQMEANASPNSSRMEPVRRRIATLESEIAALRARLTEDNGGGLSIARVQGELLVAQADVTTRQMLLSQALSAMEAARMEANRQVRYLSVSVSPVAPDEATYPRAFENTLVALLIFAGLYLVVSMTVAILREQVAA